jgi:hypothetical protein
MPRRTIQIHPFGQGALIRYSPGSRNGESLIVKLRHIKRLRDDLTVFLDGLKCSDSATKKTRECGISSSAVRLAKQEQRTEIEIRRRDRALRRNYGIEYDDWIRLIQWQHRRCAICGLKVRRFCLDHDHLTNRPRGLLCNTCNTGLPPIEPAPLTIELAQQRLIGTRNGFTKYPERLARAVEYLNLPPFDLMAKEQVELAVQFDEFERQIKDVLPDFSGKPKKPPKSKKR